MKKEELFLKFSECSNEDELNDFLHNLEKKYLIKLYKYIDDWNFIYVDMLDDLIEWWKFNIKNPNQKK